MNNYRYHLWANGIVIKSTDNLNEVIKVAEAYKDSYKELYIEDNTDHNMIWCK